MITLVQDRIGNADGPGGRTLPMRRSGAPKLIGLIPGDHFSNRRRSQNMHLKKKTAQLFSLVLTLALILSALPSGAMALQEQPPTPPFRRERWFFGRDVLSRVWISEFRLDRSHPVAVSQ